MLISLLHNVPLDNRKGMKMLVGMCRIFPNENISSLCRKLNRVKKELSSQSYICWLSSVSQIANQKIEKEIGGEICLLQFRVNFL